MRKDITSNPTNILVTRFADAPKALVSAAEARRSLPKEYVVKGGDN
jgi:hypothetical protein